MVYFFAVGAGFMCVEIYYIKRFILLVGDPVISFSVVIAGILLFSSLGGIWAYKKPPLNLRLPLSALVTALILEAVSGIQNGANPNVLEEALNAFLPNADRVSQKG